AGTMVGYKPKILCQDPVYPATFRVVAFSPGSQQFYSGINKYRSEHVQNPVKLFDQVETGGNKNGSEKNRSDNSVKKYFVMKFVTDAKIFQENQPDENIIDGQGFFGNIGEQKGPRHLPIQKD